MELVGWLVVGADCLRGGIHGVLFAGLLLLGLGRELDATRSHSDAERVRRSRRFEGRELKESRRAPLWDSSTTTTTDDTDEQARRRDHTTTITSIVMKRARVGR